MRAVVTGAAGFVGSHLCDRLLADGHEVLGIDCFRDYYPRALKEGNLAAARAFRSFSFVELDLVEGDLDAIVRGSNVVFHLAGRSGLGTSNQTEFAEYVRDNVVATQRLLEAMATNDRQRLVYAGSSSVYGDAEGLPTRETAVPRPLSSYGVTKLAGESLVHLYGRNFGLPITVLRYFTVYGPRQRPDMAIAEFARALLQGDQITIRGDGTQTRDFTYVDDVVDATLKAATADVLGDVLNVGGGTRCTINSILKTLEDITGRRAPLRHLPPSPADQLHSGASINRARRSLGWEPRVGLRAGLEMQWAWLRQHADHDRTEADIKAVAV